MDDHFEIRVKPVEELSESEKRRVGEIERLSFTDEPGDIEWGNSQWLALGYAEDEIVSIVGLLVREVLVGEKPITVGGVGGVSTHPDYRRKGYAGRLLRHTETLMRQLNLPFGVLVCGDDRVHYYASFGWQRIENETVFENRGQERVMEGNMMMLPLQDQQDWPEGRLNLNGKPW